MTRRSYLLWLTMHAVVQLEISKIMPFSFQNVMVTGCAGFIGYHVSERLLREGIRVVGIDNLNTYYSAKLKQDRLALLNKFDNFLFYTTDLADHENLKMIFTEHAPDAVVNLAAQAGVRYSLENPQSYIQSNLVGFANILECCRHNSVKHLVFASSSSVYGANTHMPFSVHHNVDHPVSLYAATKKSNELMAHTYSHLYHLPCTGLRFFTVYGPWGRPDMALFLFTKAIIEGRPIKVFNHGKMKRDFTYIDDIVDGVLRVTGKLPEPNVAWNAAQPDPGSSYTNYRIYNLGNNRPVELMTFIDEIEKALGKKADKLFLEMQPGDVPATYADIDDTIRDFGFEPKTSLSDGIRNFVNWYNGYYKE